MRYSDAIASQSPTSYILTQPGRDKKYGTKDDKVVAITSALYDPGSRSASLMPKGGSLTFKPSYTLRIVAASVIDTQGRTIDADGDGQPGGDRTVLLTKGGATVISSAVTPRAVDHLFSGTQATSLIARKSIRSGRH